MSDATSLQTLQVLENIVFLKKTPLFSAVQTRELRAVAMIASEISYAPGETIVKEGDVGDTLYVIKWGAVSITKKISETSAVELATLSQGEFFGDMSVFDAEVRSASVAAKPQCLLLRISGDDLKEVIVDNPCIAIELLRTFVKRLRSANSTIETLSRRDRQNGARTQ